MYYTLSQLKTRINSLIDSQGDDSTCAAFIFTKEDVVQTYDDEGDEIDLSSDKFLVDNILSELGDSDAIYSAIGDILDDCIKDGIKVSNL